MNISQITQSIVEVYPSRRPVMVWGAPGVGKSMGALEASKILGAQFSKEPSREPKGPRKGEEPFGFIDLRLSLRDPSDLVGVMWPDVAKNEVRNLHAKFLPRSGRGIICLDELVQATQFMQGAASQLILDGRVGEYVLPEGWYVMGCGNRMGDRAGTNTMPTHIKNRFVHMYADVDVDAWIIWALAHEIDIRVIAFIKFRRTWLHQFDPQMKGEAFATPRTWQFVSDLLRTWKGDRVLLETLIKGTVGEGAGSEFAAFLRVADKMPSLDGILLSPKTAVIPDDMSVLYAVVTGLVARASKDNLASLCAYFQRITDQGKPDFSIAAIKEITSRKDGNVLAQTRAFIEFASKHSHLMV